MGIRHQVNGKDPYELKLFDPKSYIGRPREDTMKTLNVRNVLDLKRMEQRQSSSANVLHKVDKISMQEKKELD